jgi:hypothetical protein
MRKSEIVLTLALLGTAATAFWLWDELRAERERNAELSVRANVLPVPITAPVPATPPAAQETKLTPVATKPEIAESAAQSPGVGPGANVDWYAYQRRLMQNPKYREAWRAQLRFNYSLRRENVIRLLGFTAEQADAVVDLEIDTQLRAYDRPPVNPQTIEEMQRQQALDEQDKREDQAKLLELLGSEKQARFQDYMETRVSRMQVEEFRRQLSGGDALRDDQVEPLIAALHVENARMQEEMRGYRERASLPGAPSDAWDNYNERQIEMQKTTYDRMHSAAAPVLSSGQLERLDAML